MDPHSSARPTLSLIGAGRVGSTLAVALHKAGYTLNAVFTRTPAHAQPLLDATRAQLLPDIPSLARSADLILIAVPDDAIASVDEAGAGDWQPGSGVVHCSGLHSASLLKHAAADGAFVGAMHPLQAITDPQSALGLLAGTYFGLSGDPELLPTLDVLVQALGGRPLHVPDQDRPIYHAAAVFASNYIVTCFAQAVALLTDLGIVPDDAARALLPLTQGAIANLADPGLPHALTGPIARGDTGTLQTHQQHLAARHPQTLALYRRLGQATLPIAAAQNNLRPETLQTLSDQLTD